MVHAGDAHSGPDHREGSDREASTQLIDGAAGAEGHLIADLIRTIFVAEAATGIDSHIVAEAHDGFRTHDEGAVGFDYHAGGGGSAGFRLLPPPRWHGCRGRSALRVNRVAAGALSFDCVVVRVQPLKVWRICGKVGREEELLSRLDWDGRNPLAVCIRNKYINMKPLCNRHCAYP